MSSFGLIELKLELSHIELSFTNVMFSRKKILEIYEIKLPSEEDVDEGDAEDFDFVSLPSILIMLAPPLAVPLVLSGSKPISSYWSRESVSVSNLPIVLLIN